MIGAFNFFINHDGCLFQIVDPLVLDDGLIKQEVNIGFKVRDFILNDDYLYLQQSYSFLYCRVLNVL